MRKNLIMDLKRCAKVWRKMGYATILREISCTQMHAIVHTSSWRHAKRAPSLSVLSFSPLSARSFIYRPLCTVKREAWEKALRSLFSPGSFLRAIFFSPVLPGLMAHFKRRNCSQFISGMQSATRRCARRPQSSNTISSPIKQHQRQSSAPPWEFLESSRPPRASTLWR